MIYSMKKDEGQKNFTKAFLEGAVSDGSVRNMAEAVGLPDAEDKQRIENWLLKYDKKHPGEIKFHRDAARERIDDKDYGVLDKASSRRYLFELPTEFGTWMEQAYPLMFKDRKHLAWFCKNFKYLMIPHKH